MGFHHQYPQHLVMLITTLEFTWPLKEDHMKLRRKYNDGPWDQARCLSFPSDDPSSYIMVWEALKAMKNLRTLRIDFLTTSSPMKYLLRTKDLLPKWIDPLDDLLYEKAHTLEYFSAWVPQEFFALLVKIMPGQYQKGGPFYREVRRGNIKKGYFMFPRPNILWITRNKNYHSIPEEEMWDRDRSSMLEQPPNMEHCRR
jgi:hypothetical protein